MSKTIEELIYDFANRQFQKAPINTARDLMCVCSDFANEFLAQPLSSRLTAEEKQNIKRCYKTTADAFKVETNPFVASSYMSRLSLLESIFGEEIFKEE